MWNRFDVTSGQDEVLFGLRGCELEGHRLPTGFVNSVKISETIPNHKSANCVVAASKFPMRTCPCCPGKKTNCGQEGQNELQLRALASALVLTVLAWHQDVSL
jgi:hypothetical protein